MVFHRLRHRDRSPPLEASVLAQEGGISAFSFLRIDTPFRAFRVTIRGVTNPVFAGSGSGTGTTTKGVGVASIRIFAGIGSTHGIGSFWVCTSLILIQEAHQCAFMQGELN